MNTRVILLGPQMDGTGPGRSLANLARELPAVGYTPTIASTHGPRTSPMIDELEAAGIPVVHLGMRSDFDPAGPIRLAKLVRQTKARIVHTRVPRADIAARVAPLVGGKVINNIINLPPDDILAWHGRRRGRAVLALYRWTRGPVALFVANAAALAPGIHSAFGVPERKIRVVHDGIPLTEWSEARPADLGSLGIDPSAAVCLTVARLYPQKGLGDLVDAAGAVIAERPEAIFLVVGKGPLRAELETRIDRAGLGGRVILAGWRDDVPAVMAAADLFVLPSHFEGLPNAVIEAMAAGLPVVATAVAGTPELVAEGETGWLVPPGQPGELARAIVEALKGDVREMGNRGQKRAREHFSVHAMARSFAELYEEILG